MHLKSIIPGSRFDSGINTEEALNKILLLSSGFIHIHSSVDQKIIYVTEEFTTVLGYTSIDLATMGHQIIGISDTIFPEQYFKPTIDVPKQWIRECYVKHKDGSRRILKTRFSPFTVNNGEVTEIIGISEDITEEKALIVKLQQQATLLEQSEQTMKFGSWEWDIETNQIIWSKGLWIIFGQRSETFNLNYESFLSLVDIRDRDNLVAAITDTINNQTFYEIEHRISRSDGETRILLTKGHAVCNETGIVVKLAGSAADITELRTTTNRLINSEALLLEAESIMGYGSWEYCLATKKMSWSNGMYQLHDLSGNAFSTILMDEYLNHFIQKEYQDVVRTALKEAIEYDQTFHIEVQLVTAKRQVKTILLRGRLGVDKNGQTRQIVGSINDITQLRKYEKELENKIQELNHSNQELEQFAYMASHDLQEPLRKIRAFAEFLQQRLGSRLSEPEFDSLERMRESAKRMQDMIHTLLEFSRIGRLQQSMTSIDLTQTVQKVVEDLSEKIREKQAVIHINALPTVLVVDTQIHQLFLNLIGNALKFNASVPIVIISAMLNEKAGNKKFWHISVSDNGIGFEPEYAEQIFTLFRRLNARFEYSGTGIGLAICKKIVEVHGGTIWAESEPGKGTTLTFTLPAL